MNKRRMINQDLIWLVEPYVLGQPHEIVYVKGGLHLFDRLYAIPQIQPNESTLILQAENTL